MGLSVTVTGQIRIDPHPDSTNKRPPTYFSFSNPKPVEAVIIDRRLLSHLNDQWNTSGIYVLLGKMAIGDTWTAYVGQTADGLTRRLQVHQGDPKKQRFQISLLVRSGARQDWDAAEVQWLESKVYDKLSGASNLDLVNEQRPKSGRLSSDRQLGLTEIPDLVETLLTITGYLQQDSASEIPSSAPVDPVPSQPSQPAGQERQRDSSVPSKPSSAITRLPQQGLAAMKTLIQHGLLSAGDELVPKARHLGGRGVVQADGYILVEGIRHSSLSSAACAISGRVSEPGWDFWAVASQSGIPISSLREALRARAGEPFSDTSVVGDGRTGTDAAAARRHSTGEPGPKRRIKMSDLISAGLLAPDSTVWFVGSRRPVRGRLNQQGQIEVHGAAFGNPSAAAKKAAGGGSWNGWLHWALHKPDGPILDEFRSQLDED